jgi:lipopolysaccharide transport system ATP-binding protein
MSDTVVSVSNLGKKFCKRLKRSMWYGIKDLFAEMLGRNNHTHILRKDEFWALKEITFDLHRGETIGLIGANGAGKTTLLRVLNGLIKPDEGRVEITGKMNALIALGAGFNPVLTGRENIYVNGSVLGLANHDIDRRFDDIIEFSGLQEFIDTPLQSYSSGMTVRLGFAVAAFLDPDILLVDEVLAVGDEGFQRKCLNKIGELKKSGTAIILVSHNMHSVSTFAEKIILLKTGRHQQYDDVAEGINEYKRLFKKGGNDQIQRITNGTENIEFYDVKIANRTLSPGESFAISMQYASDVDYLDAEIDTVIYCSNQAGLYFQATNKAYNKRIDLCSGRQEIRITIHDLKANNATGIIAVTIWSRGREKQLFWWRIPVEFSGIKYSTGNNFHDVTYELTSLN